MDEDYETSSDGAIRGTQGKHVRKIPSQNSEKTGSERDYDTRRVQVNETPSQNSWKISSEHIYEMGSYELKKDELSKKFNPSQQTVILTSVLSKSESMPILKSTCLSEEENEEKEVAVTSDSLLARQRKMKMIMIEFEPGHSSESNLSLSTNNSKEDTTNDSHVSKKAESKIEPSTLQDIKNDAPICSKEVTFREVRQDQVFPNEKETSYIKESRNENVDDLIDIAENPHPPSKSFYIPPVPEKEVSSFYMRQQSRFTKDLNTLLKIDGEFAPLQHEFNELRSRYRALKLTAPSLASQGHYSTQYMPSSSGYYLHRTETFGRDSEMNKNMIQDSRNFFSPVSREMINIEDSCSFINPHGSSTKCAVKANLSNDWTAEGNESCVPVNNAYFQFENPIDRNSVGSMIPLVNSSYYRCCRNQTFDEQRPNTSSYSDELEGKWSNSTFVKQNEAMSTSGRPVHQDYTEGKLTDTRNTSTTSTIPQVRMISINTTLEKRSNDRILPSVNSYFEEVGTNDQASKRNSNSSLNCAQGQSVSSSLMAIKSRGGSKTRYVNFTRVDSRTSLIATKKNQDVMTSNLDCTQKKKLQDLEVQCSDLNVKCHRKDVMIQKSWENLSRSIVSMASNNSVSRRSLKSVKVTKTDEKVIVVPISFTDGVPKPPKVPVFHFARSKCHLPKVSHHVVKLNKRSSSITQNSVFSGGSTVESTYLSQKLTNRNSGMSVSCVSGAGSSLRYRNASLLSHTAKTMSDFHHSRGKHSYASRAHSEPTKRSAKKVLHGMRSSPEDFLCET
ncbi:hypothetical protein ANTPLA_LOCUS9438 [Anthophora plagiata]